MLKERRHILCCTPSYAGNFQFHRNALWPLSGVGVAAMTDGRLAWKYLGSWVNGVSNARLKLAESFHCWKWVNYFLVAVQLIGAGTWRPQDPDFCMCVRLSLCVCVCVYLFFCFVLFCIVSIQIWHFTFAVHFAQIADHKPEFRSTVT